jgi:dienelactone hydrolase
MFWNGWLVLAAATILSLGASQPPQAASGDRRAGPIQPAELRGLDSRVFPADGDRVRGLAAMLARDEKARLRAAHVRENAAWERVKTRADWEGFRDARLRALRDSLGSLPAESAAPRAIVTRELAGDGYRIKNLVFESRPGLVVTANLYEPARPPDSMPGLLIAHSHHNPKTQGELQDMGMTWARQGCLVLIMDQLGHGERRQHPFRFDKDYPRPFRVGRQDYYFRFQAGVQLLLVGESLMGWMVRDLMRGLDLLVTWPGVDKERIIVLGSVAGGGDPAAVTAALDPRVKAVVPFNFGGLQPDYSIPADAGRDFYWFGVPDWESTRCLRLGARDGFAHWLIVASVAPRRLIYAHEFAWDPERDPAWPRLRQVLAWYGVPDHLAAAAGRGHLRGTPPESSHCNNIGPLHRSRIYPTLERWFAMPIPVEFSSRRAPEELLCLTREAAQEFRPKPLHELAAEAGARTAAAARRHLAGLDPEGRRHWLRQGWARLLGDVEPRADPRVLEQKEQPAAFGTVERNALEVEPEIVVPVVLLLPASPQGARHPVVLALAQGGKQAFLEHRAEAIAELLDGGVAVCLVDVRGTGETKPQDDSPRYNGARTDRSATEWLLGQTLVGARLRDVRSVLRHLRGRADLDARRIALWGDSFARPNPPGRELAVPLDAEPFPDLAEPLGGLLALFGALFEDGVRAAVVRGGLIGYDSLLQGPFGYVPHDALIPGALTMGDLGDVAAALAPRALRIQGPVDGLNREVAADSLSAALGPARAAYRSSNAESRLVLGAGGIAGRSTAHWLLQELRRD